MDLEKIKTLIDFVGRSNVTELTVAEKGTTVRIFRVCDQPGAEGAAALDHAGGSAAPQPESDKGSVSVKAPVFGVLHRAPSPGEEPFARMGDAVEEGQTLFIIEAMKVFNRIPSPCAGRITHLSSFDGGEVETGDILAEIAP